MSMVKTGLKEWGQAGAHRSPVPEILILQVSEQISVDLIP